MVGDQWLHQSDERRHLRAGLEPAGHFAAKRRLPRRSVCLAAGGAHSRQWAEEFADCLAAGDEDGAHTAAGAIEVKAPWSHNLAAEREMDAMVHHKNKATYL